MFLFSLILISYQFSYSDGFLDYSIVGTHLGKGSNFASFFAEVDYSRRHVLSSSIPFLLYPSLSIAKEDEEGEKREKIDDLDAFGMSLQLDLPGSPSPPKSVLPDTQQAKDSKNNNVQVPRSLQDDLDSYSNSKKRIVGPLTHG